MRRAGKFLLALLCLGMFFSAICHGNTCPQVTPPDKNLLKTAFPRSEKIVYRISWFGIKAGEVTLTVSGAGKNGWYLVALAKSSMPFSLFYPVEDKWETEITGSELLPRWMAISQSEGRYTSVKRTWFYQDQKKITFEKDTDPPVSFIVPRPTHNEISSFFIMRTLPLVAGRPVYVETFASKKSYTVEVQVLGKELLSTVLGKVNTIKVKPEIAFEGIRERQGDIYVWLTDDDRRIPVQISGQIRIGSLVAEIIEWKSL